MSLLFGPCLNPVLHSGASWDVLAVYIQHWSVVSNAHAHACSGAAGPPHNSLTRCLCRNCSCWKESSFLLKSSKASFLLTEEADVSMNWLLMWLWDCEMINHHICLCLYHSLILTSSVSTSRSAMALSNCTHTHTHYYKGKHMMYSEYMREHTSTTASASWSAVVASLSWETISSLCRLAIPLWYILCQQRGMNGAI